MVHQEHFEFPSSNRFTDAIKVNAESETCDKPFLKFTRNEAKSSISFKQFYRLVCSAAVKFHSELEHLKVNEAGYASIGFLSQSNEDCLINHFGLMSLNLTPVVLSPRNSVEILVHLLKEARSYALVYGKEHEAIAKKCQEELKDLKLIPSFKQSEDSNFNPEMPKPVLDLNKEELFNHTAIVLHSSGSTAFPKLIKISNQYIKTFINRSLNSIGTELYSGTQLLLSPLFHIFGLAISWRLISSKASIAFSTTQTLHPKQIIADVDHYQPSLLVILPFLIKQLCEYCEINSSAWGKLRKINSLLFGGAALPDQVSKLMVENRVHLMNGYGTTETGFNANSDPNQDHTILNLMSGINYELINWEEDTCQLKIKSNDPGLATGVADDDGYSIGDRIRVIEHDEKAGKLLFQILGRTDDTIIHISGEKTNPVPMEETILSCPLVQSTIILGSGKLNSCLLIQLNEEEARLCPVQNIFKNIQPFINKANSACPAHSRIDLDLVYILPLIPDKALPTTVKGNVSRKKANQVFESEIERLYSEFQQTV